MPYLVAFSTNSGSQVVVEVDEAPPAGVERAGRAGEVAERAQETLEAALGTVKEAAEALVKTLDRLARKPDEATVEFGVKLGAKAGAFIVCADAEAHFTVTLKWSPAQATPAAPSPAGADSA